MMSSWFSNPRFAKTLSRRMQASPLDPMDTQIFLSLAWQPLGSLALPPMAAEKGPCSQTHMCLSRCSVHCTRTMPSKGECSHTTPQVPSLLTTNYNEKREVRAHPIESAFQTGPLTSGQATWRGPLLQGHQSTRSPQKECFWKLP